jgi:hypothetical protein
VDGKQGARASRTFTSRVLYGPLARMLSWRIDAELAAGRPPEWSRLHAVRADQLVSPAFRSELADNWEHVLGVAIGSATASTQARSILRRDRILEAEPRIRELVKLLRGQQALPAGGVASARDLLTDGTGPLYSPVSGTKLSDAVAEVVARLDPAARS